MRKKLRKPIALLMVFVMVFSMSISVLADDEAESPPSDVDEEIIEVAEGEPGDGDAIVEGQDDGEGEEPGEGAPEGSEEDEEEEEIDLGDNPDGLDGPQEISSPKLYFPKAPFASLAAPFMVMNGEEPGDGNGDGNLELSKVAEHQEGKRWKVTLRVERKEPALVTKNADIVLIIDRSGSMAGNKLVNAKAAAVGFVNDILTESNPNIRVALISYSSDYKEKGFYGRKSDTITVHLNKNNEPFKDYNGADDLKEEIYNLIALGGTHTQAAIKQARALLESTPTENNKYIILLSDGEPTYSYAINNVSNKLNDTYFYKDGSRYYNRDNISFSDYNYNSTVGSGSSMTKQISGKYYYHNGNSAIAESRFAKGAGQIIYTIGYDVGKGSEAEKVLKGIASSGDKYYGAGNIDILDEIYGEISSKIVSNAEVTDPMGEYFFIPDIEANEIVDLSKITISSGTLSYIDGTITWYFWGTEDKGLVATMSYIVEIKDDVPGGTWPTNKETSISYITPEGESDVDYFDPIPEVYVGRLLYNANGGENPPDSEMFILDGEEATASTTVSDEGVMSKAGYTFIGWKNKKGDDFGVGTGISVGLGDLVLFAQWEKEGDLPLYKVTFNPNGGMFSEEILTDENGNFVIKDIESGSTITQPREPGFEGHTFIGWYETGSTEPFNFDTPITGDKTLYAQWEEEEGEPEYTVTYINEAGEAESLSLTYLEGNTVDVIELPAEFTKPDGKRFTGWEYRCMAPMSANINGNGNEDDVKDLECGGILQPGDKFIMPDYNLTLFAKWVPIEYTVIFKDYDGTILKTEIVEHGKDATAPANPSRSDYNFNGWDKSYKNVTSDLVVNALYSKKSTGGGGGGGGSSKPKAPVVVVPVEEIPSDLPQLNKADHIQYIQGYPDGTVKPEGHIARDEVAAVFFRLLDEEYRNKIRTMSHNFSDVASTRWSNKHIATLAKGGIITGYPDGTFKPGNYITRAELATIASRFDKLSPFVSDKFSDIKGHWANKYINSAAEKGWVKGYVDGTFKPDQYITRAEFVTLVNNVLERRVTKSEILPGSRKFPDLPEDKWFYEAMMEAINSHMYERLDNGYEHWTEIYYPEIEM